MKHDLLGYRMGYHDPARTMSYARREIAMLRARIAAKARDQRRRLGGWTVLVLVVAALIAGYAASVIDLNEALEHVGRLA